MGECCSDIDGGGRERGSEGARERGSEEARGKLKDGKQGKVIHDEMVFSL